MVGCFRKKKEILFLQNSEVLDYINTIYQLKKK